MADLTLDDVPDELLDHLRRSAKANRRSLNSEVLFLLERSFGLRPVDPDEERRPDREP
ncbi:MAG TPA: Arc family DNA-binding protein [Longimicrobium sp.]|nr:Arc family DNA-binding protein [Longimicrobium sp.]